jgi:hypothetical protein
VTTKIIDVHRHLWGYDWFPPSHLPKFTAEGIARRTNRTVEDVLERIKQSPTMDATGKVAIEEMDNYGIDASIIMVLDWGLAYGPGEDNQLPAEEFNRRAQEVVKQHPGKLWAMASYDPRRPRAVSLFEQAVKEWGAVGPGQRRALLPDVREGDRARRAGADSHGRQHLGVAGVGGAGSSALPGAAHHHGPREPAGALRD